MQFGCVVSDGFKWIQKALYVVIQSVNMLMVMMQVNSANIMVRNDKTREESEQCMTRLELGEMQGSEGKGKTVG